MGRAGMWRVHMRPLPANASNGVRAKIPISPRLRPPVTSTQPVCTQPLPLPIAHQEPSAPGNTPCLHKDSPPSSIVPLKGGEPGGVGGRGGEGGEGGAGEGGRGLGGLRAGDGGFGGGAGGRGGEGGDLMLLGVAALGADCNLRRPKPSTWQVAALSASSTADSSRPALGIGNRGTRAGLGAVCGPRVAGVYRLKWHCQDLGLPVSVESLITAGRGYPQVPALL